MKTQVLRNFDIDEVIAFIDKQSPETKILIGSDSERNKVKITNSRGEPKMVWVADYMVVVVVHIDGCHGCKIFGQVTRELDYDGKLDKPALRLMNEVYKVAEVANKFVEVVGDREMEIHLDINPKKIHGSSCVVQQAVGYIRGVCNVIPLIKPNAPAASFAADRLKRVLDEQDEALELVI